MFRIPKGSNYNEEEKEILKHALITNDDFKQVMEKYHDDVDAFVFLDPPYLFLITQHIFRKMLILT